MDLRIPDLYETLMEPIERAGLRRLRRDLLAQVRGRVLELGVGTGANLRLYPAGVWVAAIDRESHLLARAAAHRGAVPAALAAARAEDLPFGDGAFDTVVGTLVFCMVSDPGRALGEVSRVLRPGGELLLLEHVRSPVPLLAHLQDAIAPTWSAVLAGCYPNRDTRAAVANAGFALQEVRPHLGGLVLQLRATRPAG